MGGPGGQEAILPEHPEAYNDNSDGTGFYTIGFGQSATFVFDYTSIDVSGFGHCATL